MENTPLDSLLAAFERVQDTPAEDIEKHDEAEIALDEAVAAFCHDELSRRAS